MAEEEKKKLPVLLIVGMLIFGLALAGGVSYFIATKIVADKTATGSGDKKKAHEPGTMVRLGDSKDGLLINVGGVNSGRYLKIAVILEVRPDKNAAEAAGKAPSATEALIMDTVVQLLRAQKIEDFEPQKQEQLKELIKNSVNKAFATDEVYEVYITNLVLQ